MDGLFRDSTLERHGELPSLGGAGLEAAAVALGHDTDPPFRLLDRDNEMGVTTRHARLANTETGCL